MGIRESLNQNPAITTGITIGIIVIALGFIVYQIIGGGEGGAVITQMYYTTDDGKTYFADGANKLSPFDKDGAPAVRAYVFSCDERKTQFVAYLERLTPEAKQKIEAAQAKPADPGTPGVGAPGMDSEMILIEGMEVKKPGDAKWVKRTTPDGDKVTQVSCPDGNSANLNIVLPED